MIAGECTPPPDSSMCDAKSREAIVWAHLIRDFARAYNLPFFLKQVGLSHKHPVRTLNKS